MEPSKTIFVDVDDVLNCMTPTALNFLGCPILCRDYSAYKPEWGYDIVQAAREMLPNACLSSIGFWDRFPQSFWTYLPLTKHCDWLLEACAEFAGKENVCLLTKPTGAPGCADGKTKWIRRSMPSWIQKQYLIGQPKSVCAHPGSILIDDSPVNIDEFRQKGGHVITFPRPWNTMRDSQPREYIHSRLEVIFKGGS